eukprot:7761168-Alexandrium_andersonii.AAC.1
MRSCRCWAPPSCSRSTRGTSSCRLPSSPGRPPPERPRCEAQRGLPYGSVLLGRRRGRAPNRGE